VDRKTIHSFSLFAWLGVWGLIYGWNNCFFLNGTGNLKRQVFLGGIDRVIFVPLALFWGERYGLLGICMALIIVHLSVAVSNPLESLGNFTRFSKLGMPRQG
jgi:hypothetical protein